MRILSMYHRVCRIDPPGNVTESVVMFYLDDSFFFFVRLVFLEMLHSSQCSCSAPVASFCQTEHSLDVSEEWYSDYDPRECILPGSISYSPLFYLKCLLLRVCCPLDCIYVHSVFMLTASPRLFAVQ